MFNKPIIAKMYPAKPIQKLDGIRTEDFLALMIDSLRQGEANEPEETTSEWLKRTYIDSVMFRSGIFADFVKKNERYQEIRNVFKNWLETKVNPNRKEKGEKDPESENKAFGGVGFAIRGILVIDDPNDQFADTHTLYENPVSDDGSPIVGLRWDRISRNDLINIAPGIDGTLTAGDKVDITLNDEIKISESSFFAVEILEDEQATNRAGIVGFVYLKLGPTQDLLDIKFENNEGVTSGDVKVNLFQCRLKFQTQKGYGPNKKKNAGDAALVVEYGDQDRLWYMARNISPGILTQNGVSSQTGTTTGPPAILSFDVWSSITPPKPNLKNVMSVPWNLKLFWQTPAQEIDFEFQVEYRPLPDPAESHPLSQQNQPRNLQQIISAAIIKGKLEFESNGEKGIVEEWLKGEKTQKSGFTINEELVRIVGVKWQTVKDGEIFVFQENNEDYLLNINKRRDCIECRIKIRAVNSLETVERFKRYSDWTDFTDWFVPEINDIKWHETVEIGEISSVATGPNINIEVNHSISANQGVLDDKLNYSLLVRKKLQDTGNSNIEEYCAEKLIAGVKDGELEIKFNFTDYDVAAPEEKFVYSYELELFQTWAGRRVLGHSKAFLLGERLNIMANTKINIASTQN